MSLFYVFILVLLILLTQLNNIDYGENLYASIVMKKEKIMTPGQLKRYKDISKDIQKEVAKYDF